MSSIFYLVWNEKTGYTKHKHFTWKGAKVEAERLANAEPGKKFYILKAEAFSAVPEKPPITTMLEDPPLF